MKPERVYILAGTTRQAVDIARAHNLRASDFVYIVRAETLRGTRRPRVLRGGTWRDRPDLADIEAALHDRGALIEDQP